MCKCGAWNGYDEWTGEWEGCGHLGGSDPYAGVGMLFGRVAEVETASGDRYVVNGIGRDGDQRRVLSVHRVEGELMGEDMITLDGVTLTCTEKDDPRADLDLSSVGWLVAASFDWYPEKTLDLAIARGVGLLEIVLTKKGHARIFAAVEQIGESDA